MGLSENKSKQRFGLDPRNTNWSNDTSRFGHRYLQRMGWKPGSGLGLVSHATTSNIKVAVKDNNNGIGAKLTKGRSKTGVDGDETSGLDSFQRILGKLNGREDKISKELDRQRKDRIVHGRWGIHFVKGEVLRSTWDTKKKNFIDNRKSDDAKDGNMNEDPPNTKRELEKEDDGEKLKKKKKKIFYLGLRGEDEYERENKNELKDEGKKEKKEKRKNTADKKKEDNNEKEMKKGKKDKKYKQDEKERNYRKEKKDKKENKENKKKKETKKGKPEKQNEESNHQENSDNSIGNAAKHQENDIANRFSGRLAARSKYIKQKKASVLDQKALNEILMVAN